MGNFREESSAQFFAVGFSERLGGLVVDAEDLLADGVSPAGKETRFCGGSPVFYADDAGSIDLVFTESVDQAIASVIVAHGCDGDDLGAEGCEIVCGVGTTAGNDLGFTMAEDQDGGFAGDAGDIAILKYVGDKIAENKNGSGGKALDNVSKREQVDGRGGVRLLFCALHRTSLERVNWLQNANIRNWRRGFKLATPRAKALRRLPPFRE